MKLYAAITTGVLAMVCVTSILWCATRLPVQDVLFWAILAYGAAMFGFLLAADAKQKGRRRHRAARGQLPIVTIDKDTWERRT